MIRKLKTTPICQTARILFILLSLLGIGLKADTTIEKKVDLGANSSPLAREQKRINRIKTYVDHRLSTHHTNWYLLRSAITVASGSLFWVLKNMLRKTKPHRITIMILTTLWIGGLFICLGALFVYGVKLNLRPYFRYLQTVPQDDFLREENRSVHLKKTVSVLEQQVLALNQKNGEIMLGYSLLLGECVLIGLGTACLKYLKIEQGGWSDSL